MKAPVPTVYHVEHGCFSNSILFSQRSSGERIFSVSSAADGWRSIFRSNLCDKFRAELSSTTSSFSAHINHIFSVLSEEKMIRIRTFWIIASVANLLTFRNRSISQFPRNAMGIEELACFSATAAPNVPIPSLGEASRPLPAAIGYNNERPESLGKSSHIKTIPRSAHVSTH